MNCKELRSLLHAYQDGELDAVRSTEMEQHLKDCAGCEQQFENQQAISAALHAPGLYFPASHSLRRRVTKELNKAARTGMRQIRWFPSWSLSAAASVVILIIGVVIGLLLRLPSSATSTSMLASEAIAANVRSLMANHLTDVLSSDQHTVKPWFDGKLDFSPPVKDLAAQGFPLVGGRLDYLGGRPVAALVYKRRLHDINVFVWPTSAQQTPPAAGSTSHDGYNVIHWHTAGMNFWVVSDLDPRELSEFARLLQNPS